MHMGCLEVVSFNRSSWMCVFSHILGCVGVVCVLHKFWVVMEVSVLAVVVEVSVLAVADILHDSDLIFRIILIECAPHAL